MIRRFGRWLESLANSFINKLVDGIDLITENWPLASGRKMRMLQMEHNLLQVNYHRLESRFARCKEDQLFYRTAMEDLQHQLEAILPKVRSKGRATLEIYEDSLEIGRTIYEIHLEPVHRAFALSDRDFPYEDVRDQYAREVIADRMADDWATQARKACARLFKEIDKNKERETA
jgi:hypothetical protein